ncbi:endonuclease-reverse transcriptase [Lasius niger]|uniref:Endonuclease-reverse transcriptase n=1 Tax=Lasius niger TaxID=67767 RepID=A0A0J7N217_LASNI|nr:endonuclease-reverse transcriptase [Lasius niger]
MKEELNSAVRETDVRVPRLDRRKPWISDATWEVIKKRKYIKTQDLTRDNSEAYNEYGKLIKKECRRDKESYLNNICRDRKTFQQK